jgi:hypothetical protein
MPAAGQAGPCSLRCSLCLEATAPSEEEDVPLAVELGDGDPVSELSQAGVAATSGAAVGVVV